MALGSATAGAPSSGSAAETDVADEGGEPAKGLLSPGVCPKGVSPGVSAGVVPAEAR